MAEKKTDPEKGEFLIDARSVSSKFLAELLGMTVSGLSKLYQERVVTQNGKRGKYDLLDTIPRYLQSIRSSGTAEAGAKLKVQQERKLRVANDLVEGGLIKIDDAAEVFREACISWRSGASALPRRLATELSNTRDAAKIREILDHELSDLYHEFEKPLRERFGTAGETFTPPPPRAKRAKTRSKKKPRRVGGRKPRTPARKRRAGKVAK